MGWEDDLFGFLDDLEQQAEAAYDAERVPELVDRARAEYAEVTLAARLMATADAGGDVVVEVTGVGPLRGRLERVGRGWCLVAVAGSDWVVPLEAVTGLRGASVRAVPEIAWSPVARLTIASAWRRLSDEGARCVLHRRDGSRHDGVLGRVGADFVEVLEGERHDRVVLVAAAAIAAVQSRD